MLVLLFLIISLNLFKHTEAAPSSCIDFNPVTGLCYDCSHDQYRPMDFILNQSIFLANCSSRNETPYIADIFISNEKCKAGAVCNGSANSPFDDISKAFFSIGNIANQHIASFVNFYFLGSPHYVLKKNLPALLPFGLFRRVNISMSMSPCFCSFQKLLGCFKEGEVAEMVIKTDNFYIFIARSLRISNFVFNIFYLR